LRVTGGAVYLAVENGVGLQGVGPVRPRHCLAGAGDGTGDRQRKTLVLVQVVRP
jgi:hypothetical protein